MKKKIYSTLIIFALLIILMIAFVVSPLLGQIKNNSQELIIQKEKFINLGIKIANLEKFKAPYADLERFLKEVDRLLVGSEVPIEFIDFLEKTAEKTQVKIETLSVSERKAEKDFWPYLAFQTITAGSFPDFLKFLEKLENGPYLIEVQNITVSKIREVEETKVSSSPLAKAREGKEAVFAPSTIRANFSVKVFVK